LTAFQKTTAVYCVCKALFPCTWFRSKCQLLLCRYMYPSVCEAVGCVSSHIVNLWCLSPVCMCVYWCIWRECICASVCVLRQRVQRVSER
jgi:hypothetical protein